MEFSMFALLIIFFVYAYYIAMSEQYGGDPHYSEPPPNFLPPNATPTLFIEGTPPDATEREMSRKFHRTALSSTMSINLGFHPSPLIDYVN